MNSERITESWKQNYQLVKTYHEHYGNIEIPFKFKTINGYEYDEKGVNLGKWILTQRQAYNKINTSVINQSQIDLLNLLDMRWKPLSTMDKWNKRYVLAKKYYEHYGNLQIPYRFKTLNGYEYDENGIKLGTWITAQKQIYKGKKKIKLTSEQIEKLNQIGIVWNNTRIVRSWKQNYELAKKYYEHYQNLNMLKSFKTINGYEYNEKGVNLGIWITTQRQSYKGVGGRLTSKQIELLNQIGMIWERMDIWLKKYNLAKEYYNHYGNLEIPVSFKTLNGYEYDEKGINLGTWLASQRQYYKTADSRLTPRRIELLNQIGMRWDNINIIRSWEQNYELAKIYYEHYQNLNIPVKFKTLNGYEYDENGIKLGNWLATQRKHYKEKNKMESSDKRIKLLNEIHINWTRNDFKESWLKYYTLAKIYYEYHGNSNIPATFKTLNGYEYDEKGVLLGKWLANQRQAYKGIGTFEISEDRIRLLQDIKIRWLTPYSDEKLQKEEFSDKNKIKKQIEILNRIRSLLIQNDLESLPSKEEINKTFLDDLNKNLIKRK